MFKKIWKKRIIPAAVPVLLAVLFFGALPARADVIAEPYDSEFYFNHSDECVIEEAAWEINALGGVRLMKDPESDQVLYEYEKIGTPVWISLIYNNPDGGNWGYTETYIEGKGWRSGWIPMNLLWESYSHEMFLSDYSDKVREKQNQVTIAAEGDSRTVYFYAYPGSTRCSAEEFSTSMLEDELITTSLEFTDEEGRKWGYIGYYFQLSGWICLEQPGQDYDALWPSGSPERDTRGRTYYRIVYNEDSTEVAEISEPDPTDVWQSEDPSGKSSEETGSAPTETEAPPAPKPSGSFPGWALPAAAAGIAAVTAGIVLAVVLNRKKKEHKDS